MLTLNFPKKHPLAEIDFETLLVEKLPKLIPRGHQLYKVRNVSFIDPLQSIIKGRDKKASSQHFAAYGLTQ